MDCPDSSLFPHASAGTVKNIHEIWSLIDGRPIRFSLNEFEDITKLKCHPIDEADSWDANHHDFWKKMGVPISDGPTYKELEKVMACCKTFSTDERMMVGRLCLLSVGIYGIHHASRVPLSSAKRVLDPDAFEKHPWGRVAFSSLVNSIKAVEYTNDSYVIHGCVHALLIWVYESVPGLGESFGKRRSTLTGYPLLDWESSRKRITFEDFIKKEKTAYEKVRVRHMVDVSEENMYPNWSDVDEEKDTELDNLIKDVPLNQYPGDCGVFTVKYIECLALGKTFEGICDTNMKAIRIKLGAELFDEVRESNAPETYAPETSDTVSDTLSYEKRLPFIVPHLTDYP